MRLAVQFTSSNDTLIAEIGRLEEDMVLPVIIAWKRNAAKKSWEFEGLTYAIEKKGSSEQEMCSAASVLTELSKHDFHKFTPRMLMYEVGKTLGRQVQFDPSQKKHVSVKSIKSSRVAAVFSDGKIVHEDAVVEENSPAVMRVRIASIMAENPDKAAHLSKWFVDGCKLKSLGTITFINIDEVDPAPEAAKK